MKFTVNAGDFDSALKSVQGRARVSTTIPILKCILVTASDAKVSVLGNDLDSSSFASLDAEVTTPGAWALPAEHLIRAVEGLPKSAHIVVEFDGKARGQQVTVKSGRSRHTIPILPAADFPNALSAKGGYSFDVTSDELDQLFARPIGAVDSKHSITSITGVWLHLESGNLVSTGLDGHSMLQFGTQIAGGEFKGVIVPHYAISEILKIGAGSVSVTDRTIEIDAGSRSYCSKLIDGTFPLSYQKAIPGTDGPHVIIDREALIERLVRLESIGAIYNEKTIDVSVNDGDLVMTLTTSLADGAETVECESEDADGKFFCLRTEQLLDACRSLRGEKIKIFVNTESLPIRIFDPSEPDAISFEMLCKSKNRKATAVAA